MSTATTSSVVSLAWTRARVVANAASQGALGYPFKVKAATLIVTRANGDTETRTASATKTEVEQALRLEHRTAILSAIAARVTATMDAWDAANPAKGAKGHAEARTKAQDAAIIAERTAFYADGSVTFPVTARASRSATVDDTDDLAAMLGLAAESSDD